MSGKEAGWINGSSKMLVISWSSALFTAWNGRGMALLSHWRNYIRRIKADAATHHVSDSLFFIAVSNYGLAGRNVNAEYRQGQAYILFVM